MIKEPKAGFLCSHFTLTSFTIGNYRENLNELCKKVIEQNLPHILYLNILCLSPFKSMQLISNPKFNFEHKKVFINHGTVKIMHL